MSEMKLLPLFSWSSSLLSFPSLKVFSINRLAFVYDIEPSGVQALKNPNPLKDVDALVVLDVAMLV